MTIFGINGVLKWKSKWYLKNIPRIAKILIAIISPIIFIISLIILINIKASADHKRNLGDLEQHILYFKSIKHPKETLQVYYKSFFGHPYSDNGANCEHVIIQMRKYKLGYEQEILDNYKVYDNISIFFYKTLEDCPGDEIDGYRPHYTSGRLGDGMPILTYETSKFFLPIYVVEYSVKGTHLSDWECQ